MAKASFVNRASKLLLILAVLAVVFPFLSSLLTSSPETDDVVALYDLAVAQGKVDAAEIETGWDRVCLVSPYCSLGGGELGPQACEPFMRGDLWGVAFMSNGAPKALKTYSRRISFEGLNDPERLKTMESCFHAEQKPAFFVSGPDALVLKAFHE